MHISESLAQNEKVVIERINATRKKGELVGWFDFYDEEDKDALYYQVLNIIMVTDPYVLFNTIQMVASDEVFEAYIKDLTELWSVFFEWEDTIDAVLLSTVLEERYGLSYHLSETCITFLNLEQEKEV